MFAFLVRYYSNLPVELRKFFCLKKRNVLAEEYTQKLPPALYWKKKTRVGHIKSTRQVFNLEWTTKIEYELIKEELEDNVEVEISKLNKVLRLVLELACLKLLICPKIFGLKKINIILFFAFQAVSRPFEEVGIMTVYYLLEP